MADQGPSDFLHRSPQPRATKIRLLRNGSNGLKADVSMSIIPERYSSFRDFLKAATTTMKAANIPVKKGGIKSLYTIYGKEIFSIDNIENNANYVATFANELFQIRPHLQPTGVTSAPGSDSSVASVDTTHFGTSFQPRRIIIVRQGKPPRRVYPMLLNHRTALSFDQVLLAISDLVHLDSGSLHVVFTQSGKPVTCLKDFFGYHYIFFAFRKELHYYIKYFKLDEQEIELITDLSRTTREKMIITPPTNVEILGDSKKRKILPQIRIKYNLGRNIFKGRFMVIKECSGKTTNHDPRRYAMKIVSKTVINYKNIINEVSALKGLRHPRIIRLLSVQDSLLQVYMLVELATEGDLNAVLMKSKISEHEARHFTENIVSALFYLHSTYTVHRNVKPSNLLLTRDTSGSRVLKLAGFGLARPALKPLYEVCGRTVYMAPEMLQGTGYGLKVDVWAMGVVLYYMLVQVPPFLGETEDEDRELILEGKVDFSWEEWNDISYLAKDLIVNMLQSETRCRFTAEHVLNHPWISKRNSHNAVGCVSETGIEADTGTESGLQADPESESGEDSEHYETDNAEDHVGETRAEFEVRAREYNVENEHYETDNAEEHVGETRADAEFEVQAREYNAETEHYEKDHAEEHVGETRAVFEVQAFEYNVETDASVDAGCVDEGGIDKADGWETDYDRVVSDATQEVNVRPIHVNETDNFALSLDCVRTKSCERNQSLTNSKVNFSEGAVDHDGTYPNLSACETDSERFSNGSDGASDSKKHDPNIPNKVAKTGYITENDTDRTDQWETDDETTVSSDDEEDYDEEELVRRAKYPDQDSDGYTTHRSQVSHGSCDCCDWEDMNDGDSDWRAAGEGSRAESTVDGTCGGDCGWDDRKPSGDDPSHVIVEELSNQDWIEEEEDIWEDASEYTICE